MEAAEEAVVEFVTDEDIPWCEIGVVGGTIVVVAVAGYYVLPGALATIGLTGIGPAAGGWFAATQGAAIAAGSSHAVLQSLAMGGSAVMYSNIAGTFTIFGAAAGAWTGTGIAGYIC